MVFVVKAEVRNPRAKRFAFIAQNRARGRDRRQGGREETRRLSG